jgi:hypothetical protein
MATIETPWVVVTVIVNTEEDSTSPVVVAAYPPLVAEDASIVTVFVTCDAMLLPTFSAFCIAESGIGAPAISQVN